MPIGLWSYSDLNIAKGNAGAAAGLMVILAAPSAFLSPALLRWLAPILTGNQSLNIDLAKMVMTLLLGQVIPLLIGLSINKWTPNLAAKLLKPARLTTTILNLIFIGIILVAQYKLFLQITLRALVGMLLLLIASMLIGWISAVSGAAQRRATTLTTAIRNNGVGMVIATGSFAGTAAVSATVVYGVFGLLGSLPLAIWWFRRPVCEQA